MLLSGLAGNYVENQWTKTQVAQIQAAKTGGVSGHLIDRGLMVLDKKGKMVTGRKHPRMWLARVNQVMENLHIINTLAWNRSQRTLWC